MLSKDEEEEILEMLPNDEEAEELDFHHDQNGDNDDRLQPVNSNSNRQRRRRRSVAVWSVLALVISCVVISVVVVWTNRGLQKKKNNATATVTNGIGEDKYEYDENDNDETGTETTNKKEIENSNSLYLSTDHPTTVPPTVSPTVPSDEPRQQECPPKSTKPTDNDDFSREKLTSAGCVPLDCLSELELRNTRDRLGPLAHLCKGQALCNGDAEKYPGTIFQFGLSENGSLVWQQCNPSDPSQTEVRVLREGNEKSDQVWFTMTAIGTWQIWESSSSPSSLVDATTAPNATTVTTATNAATTTPSLVWTQSVDDEQNISGEIRRCLHSRPVLDCPYLHFRRHGAVVLNYIDDQGSWVACDCQKSCFPGLWQNN